MVLCYSSIALVIVFLSICVCTILSMNWVAMLCHGLILGQNEAYGTQNLFPAPVDSISSHVNCFCHSREFTDKGNTYVDAAD